MEKNNGQLSNAFASSSFWKNDFVTLESVVFVNQNLMLFFCTFCIESHIALDLDHNILRKWYNIF